MTNDAVQIMHTMTDDPEMRYIIAEEREKRRVASLIYEARTAAGLTQAELAARVGTRLAGHRTAGRRGPCTPRARQWKGRPMITQTRATVEDLYAAPGKAELVNGELLMMSPTGDKPGWAGDEIFASLHSYVRMTSFGRAVSDNKGFLTDLPGRKSFSPDAAFYTGRPGGMKFFPDVPIFAAEVRSENDYSPQAEREMAAKRADYFAAGCRVVWDVDLLSDEVVRVYRATAPDALTIYRRGEMAEAEPAVPGWKMPVDDLFE